MDITEIKQLIVANYGEYPTPLVSCFWANRQELASGNNTKEFYIDQYLSLERFGSAAHMIMLLSIYCTLVTPRELKGTVESLAQWLTSEMTAEYREALCIEIGERPPQSALWLIKTFVSPHVQTD